ncbi:hypothetical protein [Pseudomonas sp. PSE1(2024)]
MAIFSDVGWKKGNFGKQALETAAALAALGFALLSQGVILGKGQGNIF